MDFTALAGGARRTTRREDLAPRMAATISASAALPCGKLALKKEWSAHGRELQGARSVADAGARPPPRGAPARAAPAAAPPHAQICAAPMAAKMGGAWRHAKSWFPSHMGKAMGEMTERIKAVDVVIEVRDCRAPISSAARHLGKLLSEYGRTQRRLVVLNKADLVTAAHRRAAVANLVADAPAVHLTSARDGRGVEAMLDAAVGVVAEHSPRVLNTKQAPSPRRTARSSGAPGTDEVSALPLSCSSPARRTRGSRR